MRDTHQNNNASSSIVNNSNSN